MTDEYDKIAGNTSEGDMYDKIAGNTSEGDEYDRIAGVDQEDGGFISGVGEFLGDAATQTYRQIGGGIRDAAQETYNTAAKVTNYVTEPLGLGKANLELPEVERPEGVIGNLTREGVRAGVGMVPANKALKVAGMTNTGLRGAASSAVAAGTVYGEDDPTGSDFLKEAGLDTSLTGLFETNEDDTFWERKSKHFGEDLLLSAGMSAVPYVARGFKTADQAAQGPVVNPQKVNNIRKEADTVSEQGHKASNQISKSQEQIIPTEETSEIFAKYKEIHPSNSAARVVSETLNDKLVYEAAQEVVTGVKTTSEDMKRVLQGSKAKVNFEGDVALLPGVNYRMLSNVAAKTHATLESGPLKALGGAFNVYDKEGNLVKAASQSADTIATGSKGYEQITAPFYKSGQLDNFMNLVGALRAKKLHSRGIENPIPEDAAEKVIEDFGSKPQFRAALKDHVKYTNDLLEYQRASGLFSAEDVANMRRENPVFIPFYKQSIDSAGNTQLKASRNPKKRIKGSKDNLGNLYGNMVRYTMDSIEAADKNRAKLSFIQMLERGHEAGKLNMDNIMVEVKDQNIFAAIRGKVMKELKEAGVEVGKDEIDKLNGVAGMVRRQSHTHNGKTYEIVYDDGKPRMFEVKDPWLRDTIKSTEPMELNRYVRLGSETWNKGKNLFSTAITHSADFVFATAPRDAVTSHVNSVTGVKSWSYPINYARTFTLGQTYRKALVSGVGFANRTANANVDDAYTALEQYGATEARRAKTSKLFGKKVRPTEHSTNLRRGLDAVKKDFFGRGWRGLHEFSMRAEMAMRLGEFVGAKNMGASDQLAAFMGQEIATNFSMKGSNRVLQGYQNKVPFLRAGMNGMYRMTRKGKESPARVAAAAFGVLGGADLSLWTLNSQFDEYYQQDQRTRDMYYMIPNYKDPEDVVAWVASGFSENKKPQLDEESPFYTIPKPFDYGQIGTAMVGMAESIKNKSGWQAVQAFQRAAGNLIPFTGDALPVGAKQVFETYTNKAWHGGDIVPSYIQEGRETVDQYRASTDEIAKSFSKTLKTTTGISTSPMAVEYFYRSLMPGLASIPIELTEEAMRPEGMGEAPKSRPAEANKATDTSWVSEDDDPFTAAGKRVGEGIYDAFSIFITQGTERFFADSPPKSNAYLTELYEISNKAKQVAGSDNAAQEVWKMVGGQTQELEERMQDPKKQAQRIAREILSPVLKDLTDINEAQNIIRAHPDLSAEQKTTEIDKLEAAKNDLARVHLNVLKEMPELDVMWDSFLPGMNKKTEGAKSFNLNEKDD